MITPTLERDGMRYWRLPPDARLRPWIHCYWLVEPAYSTPAVLPDLLIPDGHSEIVFRMSGAFTRWQLGSGSRACMDRSYVIGGRSRSVLTLSPGGLRLAGVKLEPRALRSLLRMPLSQLRDSTVDLADLGCRALRELEPQVLGIREAGQLPALLDRFFLRHLGDDVDDDAAVQGLISRLRATRGAQPILAWAREQGLDARTLERRFLVRVGITPKQFARVERFKHSYLHAQLDGFYDQSHFDREYRHFTGASPLSRRSQPGQFTTTVGDHLLEGELLANGGSVGRHI